MRTIRIIRLGILALVIALALLEANLSMRTSEIYQPGAVGEDTCFPKYYFPREQHREWNDQHFPMLFSAVQHSITKETYLIFKIRDGHTRNGEQSLENARWTCNGVEIHENPIIQTDLLPKEYTGLKAMVVVCPPIAGPLNKLEIALRNGKRFEYKNLSRWWNCQVNHHPMTKRLRQLYLPTSHGAALDATENTGNILSHIVVSNMIKGPGPQAYLPQWIAYHRRVFGIGHFFIYIDEPWDVFSRRGSYQEWDYVTYVPFTHFENPKPFSISLSKKKKKKKKQEFKKNFFQMIQQSDMMYRIKAFNLKGAHTPLSTSMLRENANLTSIHSKKTKQQPFGSQVQWIGMFDMDEYLYVPPGAVVPGRNIRGDPTYRYAKYLDSLLAAYGPGSGIELAGLHFENVFYDDIDGRVLASDLVKKDGSADATLLCDYTHRSIAWGPPDLNGNITIFKGVIWYRQKFFARPDVALFTNVHVVIAPKVGDHGTKLALTAERTKMLNPETELRHNHFKLGCFFEDRANMSDTSMKDEFCTWMKTVV